MANSVIFLVICSSSDAFDAVGVLSLLSFVVVAATVVSDELSVCIVVAKFEVIVLKYSLIRV